MLLPWLLALGLAVPLAQPAPDTPAPLIARWLNALQHSDRGTSQLAATLLELATVGGAVALGRSDTAGSLQVGRPADLAVVRLGKDAGGLTAWDRLMHPSGRVLRTMRRGRWCDA